MVGSSPGRSAAFVVELSTGRNERLRIVEAGALSAGTLVTEVTKRFLDGKSVHYVVLETTYAADEARTIVHAVYEPHPTAPDYQHLRNWRDPHQYRPIVQQIVRAMTKAA